MTVSSPKAKILLYLILAISLFVSDSFFVTFLLLIIVALFACRVPLATLRRGLIPIIIFLLFTFVSNVFFQKGKVLVTTLGLSLTAEGLSRGALLTLRLLILILGAKVLTATTKAEDLVAAVGELLGPLGRTRFAREVIETASLTLRLLPIVYDEARDVYRSMKNRGGQRGANRIKLCGEVLTVLFQRCLKRAKEMSKAEEEFGH